MRRIVSVAVIVLATATLSVAPAASGGERARPAQAEQELVERARAIHERVITLDTHKDISANLASQDVPGDPEEARTFRERNDPTVRGTNQVDFPKMREGGLDVAFFIVYVGQGNGPLNEERFAEAKEAAMAKFEAIHRMVDTYPEHIGLARGPEDVRRLVGEGKLVAAIGIENGFPMGTDSSLISQFKELGAGYMGITHNGHNQLGDSQSPADEPLHGGLSELGRQAVAEMNRVGIMVDVSHAAKSTMLDVIEVSSAPVIASHSAVHALRPHGRNLDDEQLLALKENGGVIQTVAFASYVKDTSPRREAIQNLRQELGLPGGRGGRGGRGFDPERLSERERAEYEAKLRTLDERMVEVDRQYPNSNVQDLADHIDYAVDLIGIDHVGISSDFDGGGGVDGWNDASETFNVTLELVRRGYTEEQIAKLWSGNLLRVWGEVQQIAEATQAAASTTGALTLAGVGSSRR